jgi:dipeptidyl aminopeptidase/acylaminoacyl peptidase
VTTLDAARGETAHRWPNFLPDGRHFLYTVDGREGGLYVAALDSNERKRIVAYGHGGHYVSPGYLLFLRGTTLMAQHFDATALEARGDAFALVENVGLGSVIGTGFSVARRGSIVYRPITEDPSQLFWFTRDGSRLGPSGPAGSYRQVALSPDGRQAALTRRDPVTGGFDLWLLDLTTGALSRFTSDPDFTFNDDPVWSPDGRSVAFQSRNTTGQFRSYTKDLITGARHRLAEEPMPLDDWMPDGQFILAHRFSKQGIAAYALSPTGAEKPRVLFDAPYFQDQLHASPNGQWVAFNANESGRFEVYVAKFPQFTERRQISIAGGVQPLWRRDGRELFYLTMQGVLMSAGFNPDSPTEAAVPRALFDTNLPPESGLNEYAVTADGQRFLVVQRQAQTITILMNWLDGRESN